MNWDDLRVFLALARNGRVSKASQSLEMDSTTLIRRVKKLEESLNCSLFELSKKGYLLTDHGLRLVQYIEKAEHFVLEAQHDLTNERKELSGIIRVSVSEGFGTWFLAPLLPAFKREFPNISIELVATSGFLNINKREADIAILLEKPTKGLLYTKRLTDYSLRLYMHQQLLSGKAIPKHYEDLKPYPVVSYVPDLLYAPQLKFIEESLLSPLHSLSSTSINAQYQMLNHQAGVGILPCFIANHSDDLVAVLEDKVKITRTFWVATHRDVRHLARIQAFLDWLTDMVEGHQTALVSQ